MAGFTLWTAACGGVPRRGLRPGGEPEPVPLGRSADVYRALGLVVGAADFPAVGRWASFAGPADSTFLFFAMALPPAGLRFQREEDGFAAQYRVAITVSRGAQRIRRLERTETIRVVERRETMRTDEAVLFQTFLPLEPGEYELQLRVQDLGSPRGLEATDTLRVPAYGAGGLRFSPPLVVEEAQGRDRQSAVPRLFVDPRSTVRYGSRSSQVYLEAYGVAEHTGGVLEVRDAAGTAAWRGEVAFRGGTAEVRSAVVSLPVESLPIGRLELAFFERGQTRAASLAPLLVTLSDTWVVADFEEVLDYMSYIAEPEELDSLRAASGAERARLWDAFWAARDPDPTTSRNEYRDAYFERVHEANLRFRESGTPGWRTDRGMVYLVLGAPQAVQEQPAGAVGQPRLIVWLYQHGTMGRVELSFVDDSGFGRYRLTARSRADFHTLAERVRRPARSEAEPRASR